MSITKVLESLHKLAVEENQKTPPPSRQLAAKQQFHDWRNSKRYGSVPKDENVKKSVEYCKKVVSLIGESTRTFEKDLQDLQAQYKNHLHNVACKRDVKLACEKYLSSCRLATSEYSLDPDTKDADRPRTVDQQCMAKFRKAITYNTFTNTDCMDTNSGMALNPASSYQLCSKTTKYQIPKNKANDRRKNLPSRNVESNNVLKHVDSKLAKNVNNNKCKIPVSIKNSKKTVDVDSIDRKKPCNKLSKQEHPCGSEDKCQKPPKQCSKERSSCQLPQATCNQKNKCKKALRLDKEQLKNLNTKVAYSEQCVVENQKKESNDSVRQVRLNRVLQDYFGQDYRDTEYFKHHGYSFHDMFIHLERYRQEQPSAKPSQQLDACQQ